MGRVVSSDASGTIRLWEQGQTIVTLTAHTEAVRQADLGCGNWAQVSQLTGHSGQTIASAAGDGTVRLWNLTL